MVTTCSRLWLSLLIMLVVCGLARIAQAQCDDQGWITTGSIPGAGPGPVNAMTWWDPDGDGPVTRKVVIAGDFTAIGNQPIDHIALYDPELDTWSQLGPPGAITGNVNAMVILPNNHILLGGQMTLGTTPVILAEWDGAAWGAFVDQNVLPQTVVANSSVSKLVALPTGQIYVGGEFLTMTRYSLPAVARWSGTAWGMSEYLDTGLGNSTYTSGIVPIGIDQYIVAQAHTVNAIGGFNHAGFPCLYRRTPSTWTQVGPVYQYPSYAKTGVTEIAQRPDGMIFVSGNFLYRAYPQATTYSNADMAKIIGDSFEIVPTPFGLTNICGVLASGDLIVTNTLQDSYSDIMSYDGQTYTSFGCKIFGKISSTIELPDGDLLFGGRFDVPGGTPSVNLARFRRSDNTWRPLGNGTVGKVRALALASNGDLLAGGDFTVIEGLATRGIAKKERVSGVWKSLGGGISPQIASEGNADLQNPTVWSIAAGSDGRIYIGGNHRGAGSVQRNGLSVWNGLDWAESELIPPIPVWPETSFRTIRRVYSLAVLPDGLFVGCQDDSVYADKAIILDRNYAWRSAQCPNTTTYCHWEIGTPLVCSALSGGRFIIGSSYGLGYWTGMVWRVYSYNTPGFRIGYVKAVAVLPDDSIVIVGDVNVSCDGCPLSQWQRGILRFDGSSFSPFGNTSNPAFPQAVAARPNGEVIVGGKGYLKRWTGTQWQPLANTIDGTVYALQILPDGDLAVGGDFATIDGVVRPAFAIYRFGCGSCPADLGAQGGIPGHDGLIDNNDFFVFLNHFFDSNPHADLGSTGGVHGSDGLFDNNDFVAFIDLFFAGC